MLFKQYYQPLVNYCFTLVKDRDDAEDIVQQTFASIWQKKEELDIQTSVKSYLYRAVHNAGLNKIKQNKVRASYASDAQYTMSMYTTHEPAEPDELKEKISAAIDQLPEQCGKIFRMSRFEEMKYQEIADTLGLSVKTVENQMGKALKILRETLKDHLVVVLIFLNELY
jgi:RNA polymerase sigma-70 factor (ECF subfamily)